MLIAWAIFIQAVVFVIVIIVLKRILYSDTRSALNRLKEMDEENRKREGELKKKEEELEKEHQEKLRQAEEEIKRLKQEAGKEAEKTKQEILDKAEEKSRQIIKAAYSSKETMQEEIAEELKKDAIEFCCALISQAFTAKQLSQLQQGLIEDVIRQIESLNPGDLCSCPEKGELIFNYPLTENEKTDIMKGLSKKASREISLKEEKDAGLIAGVIVRMGNLVIDGTILGALQEAAEGLKNQKLKTKN
jgi:F-type H+-transporting ATPase subunit b